MNMSDENLKVILNLLYSQAIQPDANIKLVIAKAVSVGMKYQEEKIKEGINKVFENLNIPVPS